MVRRKPVKLEESITRLMAQALTGGTPPKWHSLSSEEVLRLLGSPRSGLSSEESAKRLAEHGPNEIPREKPRSPLYYFLKQIRQPLIYVLIAAALITSYLGEWIDTAVIVAVVLANAAIGFMQERKAGQAVEELLKYEVASAKVKRDGAQQMISSKELVPGDVVVVQAGDMVPADMRFLTLKDLFVDESLMTGESTSVTKSFAPLADENLVPADQTNMGFLGTFVVRGRGEAVVVATGAHTEISKISGEIAGTKEQSFPLMEKISRFSKLLSVGIALVAMATFALGLTRGYELIYMFRASVALAVAAIPEGLPAMLTVAMAFGVRAMAKRNAIVRSLPAVEALGSTTVICSDKTGTLTMNRMTVVKAFVGRREVEADPPDYRCVKYCDYPGPISPLSDPDLVDALTVGKLCNDAVMRDGTPEGDPTETALLLAAHEVGLEVDMKRIDEIPFETTLGYMATLHEGDGKNIILVKGAPERLLPKCRYEQVQGKAVGIEAPRLIDKLDEMGQEAMRVLAHAKKEVPRDKRGLDKGDIDGLTFLGLVGMIDPPRPEAREAVAACRSARIRVVMITGDHRATAAAIGRNLGIVAQDGRVVTGEDLELMEEADFRRAVSEVNVFARTTPEHKLEIVRALTESGEVVAVTGDGVNDTPALKAASIGVAMGLGGTDAAKAAADIVLKDDNFATIVAAVEEGRDVYAKLEKIIAWTIPTNIGESLLLMTAILLGAVLPLLPLQILWVNLVTAITLAIPLVMEPRERGLLERPPRPPRASPVTRLMLRKFVIVSALMVVGTYGIFAVYYSPGEPAAHARTVAINTLVMFEIFYLLSSRSLTEAAHTTGLKSNMWIVAGIVACLLFQVVITYARFMNIAFDTVGVGMVDWVLSAAVASSVFFAIEAEKVMARRFSRPGFPE